MLRTDSKGYQGFAYAESLAHIGQPIKLGRSRGWCLVRTIEPTSHSDVVGPYPFYVCEDWSRLAEDVNALSQDAVTLTIITDPFADVSEELISDTNPRLFKAYKQHYVVELGTPPVSEHHRRNIKAGLRNTKIEIEEQPERWLPDWNRLYDLLILRHSIEGAARFSPESFARQFRVPGMLVARAMIQEKVVGMTLWAMHGEHAYYHLGAYDEQGYQARASYAMFSSVFEFLTTRGVRQIGLGAGAGVHASSTGLERFKRGWATGFKQVYLCGWVLNNDVYDAMCHNSGQTVTQSFFPAYRAI